MEFRTRYFGTGYFRRKTLESGDSAPFLPPGRWWRDFPLASFARWFRIYLEVSRRRASTMAKKTGKRKKKVESVFLVCEETGDYNYTIRRKLGGEKLKLKKYSPRLRKHTLHVEKKK